MEPVLIIMAAGMGSRYGGLKQIDPVTTSGEIILDFSLYDAYMAGFKKAIFIIKEENRGDFETLMTNRAGKHMEIEYAYQKLENIPKGYKIPEGRVKPWGTAHAIMSAAKLVNGPFAVINADDYYGSLAFSSMYDFLADKNRKPGEFAMVAYKLQNTISLNGHVARGVCQVNEKNMLTDIVERTKIAKRGDKICFTEDEKNWVELSPETPVSMNFWGYTSNIMNELELRFPEFLDETIKTNPEKGEYLIPKITDELVKEGKATVRVLRSQDKWFGVTYKEDKMEVMRALESMKDQGFYPELLWQ